jgi:hypothetical protein
MVDTTYRADLRELNELNYARFDAKVGQRFAESEARFEKRLAELESSIEKRFAEMEQRFAEVDLRFAQIDQRFAGIDGLFSESDAKLERRLGDLRADLIKWMFIFWATTSLSVLGMLKL